MTGGTTTPTSRIPDTLRVLGRFVVFRPGLVLAYLATDVVWNYAMFLIPGLLLRAVLDAVSRNAPAGPGPWSLLAILGAAQISSFVAGGLGGWYSHQRAQQTYATLARANLLARLLRRPAAIALPFAPSEALARFDSDVFNVSGEVVILETLSEGVVILIAMVLLSLLAGWLAALVIAPLVVIAVGASWSSSRVRAFRQALQESIAEVTTFLGGVFGALPVIRTAGAEADCSARFRRLMSDRQRATLRDTVLTRSLSSLSSQTYGVAIGVLLLLLAARVRGGELPVGDLALVVTYAGTVATAGSWLGGDLAAWRQYGVSLRRLGELLPGTSPLVVADPRPVLRGPLAAPHPVPAPAPPFRSLDVRGLTCSRGGAHTISGVDLLVRPGELVVVTGRVGAGKSTLLRAVLGMLPAEGEVLWNGTRVAEPASFLVPPRCGYLAQAPILFSGTLRENLTLERPVDESRLRAALEAAELNADLASFPAGLETQIGRRGLRLSGGQAQRVALARLLALHPQVAVLDDLSSALDPATEAAIVGHLREQGDLACLAVSHRRGVLAAADRVIVLRAGRVEAAGPPSALLRDCAEFRAIWHGDGEPAPLDTASA